MRTVKSKVALLMCFVLLLASVIGLTMIGASASTMDKFEANDGSSTDFQDTWGQGGMSADIVEGDKTLVRSDNKAWGWRMVNNYKQVLDGATFDADVYLSGVAISVQTIYYGMGDAGAYWDGGGLNIAIIESSDSDVAVTKESATIRVGWWMPDYGIVDGDPDTLTWEKQVTGIQNGKISLQSELKAGEGGAWTLSLTIDGELNTINIPVEQADLFGLDTEGYLGVGVLKNSNAASGDMFVVFKDYSDANRKAYYEDASLQDLFTKYDEMAAAYEQAKSFGDDATAADASEILYTVTVNLSEIQANANIRRFEKGSAQWYYDNTLSILEELFKDSADEYALIELGVSINYFYDMAQQIATEEDVAVVDSLRLNVDYDRLDELAAMGVQGADELMDKYLEGRELLNAKKDFYVNEHLTAFENAVKDLSTNEKIREAAALQKEVVISDALSSNRAAYTERYDAATETLVGKIVGYAGDLADSWDIYNVTFVQANDKNEIEYEASDYFNDDATNDVGITLKQQVKLDGLSFEITVKTGDFHKDSWFGFFITGEKGIFNTGTSRGIITLLKPFEATDERGAYTQLRMGYPALYGNEGAVIAEIDADLYNNTMKFEFKKEQNQDGEEVYNCYITVTKASDGSVVLERYLAKSMTASTIDNELENGMAYLTFGSCDASLVGMTATIHTINGVAAAEYGVSESTDPGDDDNDKDDGQDDTPKGGCSGIVTGTSIVLGAALLAGAAVVMTKKRGNKN